jgi:hypothetical protein
MEPDQPDAATAARATGRLSAAGSTLPWMEHRAARRKYVTAELRIAR